MAASPAPEDILAISLEKGGTSVLADGYLVAGRAPLDGQAVKLGRYLAAVLERAGPGATARRSALCDAIGSGLSLMFLESVGKHPEYFSGSLVRRSKQAFPVRFSYLRKLRRRLGEQLPPGRNRLSDLDSGLVALMALSSRAFAPD